MGATGIRFNVKSKETQMDSNFFALWPIMPFGGEDGDGDQTPKDDVTQGNSGADGGQDPKGDGKPKEDTESEDDDEDDDEFKGLSAAELRSIAKENAKKAKDATKEANKLKAKEAAEERKKNDENTNLKKDLEAERESVSTLRATVVKQAITGAIRDDSRYTWNDVSIVAGLLDPEVVKVNDEGRVEGLKAQLTKIAKEHAFLLKSDNTGNNQQGGQQNRNDGGPTGFQPGQGGAGNGGNELDRKKLAEEYPALASRI